jgi:hypothetical protein
MLRQRRFTCLCVLVLGVISGVYGYTGFEFEMGFGGAPSHQPEELNLGWAPVVGGAFGLDVLDISPQLQLQARASVWFHRWHNLLDFETEDEWKFMSLLATPTARLLLALSGDIHQTSGSLFLYLDAGVEIAYETTSFNGPFVDDDWLDSNVGLRPALGVGATSRLDFLLISAGILVHRLASPWPSIVVTVGFRL